MPFIITPRQNNSERQQTDDIEFSHRADSGIQSLASSVQHLPRSQNARPYENRAMFPLPQLQLQTLPMTPMPRQPPALPNPICDSQPSDSITPPNLTKATDKDRIAHFAAKNRKR